MNQNGSSSYEINISQWKVAKLINNKQNIFYFFKLSLILGV